MRLLIPDMSLETMSAENEGATYVALSARGQELDMNLQALASANNGESKAAVLRRHCDTDDCDVANLRLQVLLRWP